MSKTLNMTFTLDSGRAKTLSLADPKADIESADVEPVMESIIEHQALLVGTAVAASIKGAVVREVTETKII